MFHLTNMGGVAPKITPELLPEWAVFNLKWWDRDALLDWITPTVAVVAVALLSMWK